LPVGVDKENKSAFENSKDVAIISSTELRELRKKADAAKPS